MYDYHQGYVLLYSSHHINTVTSESQKSKSLDGEWEWEKEEVGEKVKIKVVGRPFLVNGLKSSTQGSPGFADRWKTGGRASGRRTVRSSCPLALGATQF